MVKSDAVTERRGDTGSLRVPASPCLRVGLSFFACAHAEIYSSSLAAMLMNEEL